MVSELNCEPPLLPCKLAKLVPVGTMGLYLGEKEHSCEGVWFYCSPPNAGKGRLPLAELAFGSLLGPFMRIVLKTSECKRKTVLFLATCLARGEPHVNISNIAQQSINNGESLQITVASVVDVSMNEQEGNSSSAALSSL